MFVLEKLRAWARGEAPDAVRAVELKRGGVYVLECDEPLCQESLADVEQYLAKVKARTGCEFVILDRGFHIATTEPRHGD